MKIKPSILIIFLLLQNCKRDEPIFVKSWGNISVEFNKDREYFRNQIFAEISTICDDPLLRINMSRTDNTNYPYSTDIFLFYGLPSKKGTYRLINYKKQPECKDVPNITDIIALYSREEGDATIQSYKVLDFPKENNYLQIDDYNKDTKEIKGRFQVVFVVDSPVNLGEIMIQIQYALPMAFFILRFWIRVHFSLKLLPIKP